MKSDASRRKQKNASLLLLLVGPKGEEEVLPRAPSEPPALVNRKGHASAHCAVVWTMPNACANNARPQDMDLGLLSLPAARAACLLQLPLQWNWPKWVLSGHNKRKTSYAHFSAHQGQPQ